MRPILDGIKSAYSDENLVKKLKKGVVIGKLTVSLEMLQYYSGGRVDATSCGSGYLQDWVLPIVGFDITGSHSSHAYLVRWSANVGWIDDNRIMKVAKYTDNPTPGKGACGIYSDLKFLKMHDYDDD